MTDTIVFVDESNSTVTVDESTFDKLVVVERELAAVEVQATETVITSELGPSTIEFVAQGLQGPPGVPGEGTEEPTMSKRYDFFPEPNVVYIGEAVPGTADGDPLWKIRRIDFDGDGDPTQTLWAAEGAQTQVWTNRYELVYS